MGAPARRSLDDRARRSRRSPRGGSRTVDPVVMLAELRAQVRLAETPSAVEGIFSAPAVPLLRTGWSVMAETGR